jgi:hypothetical protein
LTTLYLPRNYPIPRYYRYSSMSSVVISVIDLLSGTIGGISVRPDILPATGSKVSIGYPRTSASDKRGRIESYRHRLRSVTECPRLRYSLFENMKLKCQRRTVCANFLTFMKQNVVKISPNLKLLPSTQKLLISHLVYLI